MKCSKCDEPALARHSYCSYHKRISGIKHLFKVTEEEAKEWYDKALNGVCDICGRESTSRWKALNIDHDHRTGKIRGVLCHSCNIALGHLDDDLERIMKMVKYLHGKLA